MARPGHDVLTDLPNRVLLQDRAQQAIAQAQREGKCVAVIYLDLDGFKAGQRRHGPRCGRPAAGAVVRRLQAVVRQTDTVCRQGGDEFVLLLPAIGGAEQAGVVARKLMQQCVEPFVLQGRDPVAGAQRGISLYPQHGQNLDELTRHADAAMYAAKQAGRNQIRQYQGPATPPSLVVQRTNWPEAVNGARTAHRVPSVIRLTARMLAMRFARNGRAPCRGTEWKLLQARANNFDGLAFCQGLPCGAVFQERASVPDLSKITCIEDLRVIAQRRVPRMFYDYADSGSYTGEPTAPTRSDFQRIKLRQRVAVNMEEPHHRTTMVGRDVTMPVAIAPTGLTGMQHADGEILGRQGGQGVWHSVHAVHHEHLLH